MPRSPRPGLRERSQLVMTASDQLLLAEPVCLSLRTWKILQGLQDQVELAEREAVTFVGVPKGKRQKLTFAPRTLQAIETDKRG